MEHADRRAKLEELRARGIAPYAHKYEDAAPIGGVVAGFDEEHPGEARIAGRIMAVRRHGKAMFADLKDHSGRMQAYFKRDVLGEESFDLLRLVDLGDFLGVRGPVGKTRTGEVTIFVDEWTFLTKALRPIPEKWHGLKDVELRYRRRYVDLFANDEVASVFRTRSAVVRGLRAYLDARGFLEVETPMMHSIAGGAAARPFVTHHNTLDMQLYLRVAPELYLKRLLVGGLDRVYELNRSFRNEGISTRHNPEYTMLEAYCAYADYRDCMDLVEEMICNVAESILGPEMRVPAGEDGSIDLRPPWRREKYRDLFLDAAKIELEDREGVLALAARKEIPTGDRDFHAVANDLFEELVEPGLVQPTFVYDYPTAISPLSKSRADDPTTAERFELFIRSMELVNAFSELNDPMDQEARFRAQVESRDPEAPAKVDLDYVEALEHGMPPAAGLGLGVDRLTMLLTNSASIRDVILFPLLRPSEGDETE
jgi:lysyl-tRNA synthetase class 2